MAFVCLFVCLSVFPHYISETDADNITKLQVDIVHQESWRPIYFGVRRSRSRGTKNSASKDF